MLLNPKKILMKVINYNLKNNNIGVSQNIELKEKSSSVEVSNGVGDVKDTANKKNIKKYTSSLKDMMVKVNSEPLPFMYYSGIKENSVGFVFGPPKSGKTIYCENLAMSIASGSNMYLDQPLNAKNKKVLILSFEEFYSGRTIRNKIQLQRFGINSDNLDDETEVPDWIKDNYIVISENMPRYISTVEDWDLLRNVIDEIQPGVVIIDSLTRLYAGSIEDSKTAKELMQKLRELANSTKTTIIVIHHAHKLTNQPLSISTMAGSRVIGQEADFMIGINKTLDGTRYIKEVAFRYLQENSETVKTFNIDESLWISITGNEEEAKLLAAFDGRKDDINKDLIYNYIASKTSGNESTVCSKTLENKFVATGKISRQTLFNNINKLVAEKKISKVSKGNYSIAC